MQEEIKEITVAMLEKLVERGKTMAVLFYDPNDDEDHMIMDELEKIDDDCRRLVTTSSFVLFRLVLDYLLSLNQVLV
jgi:hypothetical protein